MILESYAEVYSWKKPIPASAVQYSDQQEKTTNNYVNYSSHARQPLSRVNVTGLLH